MGWDVEDRVLKVGEGGIGNEVGVRDGCHESEEDAKGDEGEGDDELEDAEHKEGV